MYTVQGQDLLSQVCHDYSDGGSGCIIARQSFHIHCNVADTKLIVDGKEFHADCFCCVICSVKLDKIYGSKDGDYYCENCYVDTFGKKCAGCSEVSLSIIPYNNDRCG